MNPNKTLIVGLIDRSGSMSSIRQPTIDNWNKFIEEQRAVPGECDVSLVIFDAPPAEDWYKVLYPPTPIVSAPPLDTVTFVPRGGTALWASMHRLVAELGDQLREMPEAERPGKIIIVTVTDGYENASQHAKPPVTAAQVNEKVTHQQEKYNWQFVYLGANQDAILAGGQVGFMQCSSLNYAANFVGTQNAYAVTSNAITSFRTGAASGVTYTDEDRKKAMGA